MWWYLRVLLVIAAVNSVLTLARAFSFAYAGLVAARRLHQLLLSAVLAAPMLFFESTSAGIAQGAIGTVIVIVPLLKG